MLRKIRALNFQSLKTGNAINKLCRQRVKAGITLYNDYRSKDLREKKNLKSQKKARDFWRR